MADAIGSSTSDKLLMKGGEGAESRGLLLGFRHARYDSSLLLFSLGDQKRLYVAYQ
jgi:hypothetical protein